MLKPLCLTLTLHDPVDLDSDKNIAYCMTMHMAFGELEDYLGEHYKLWDNELINLMVNPLPEGILEDEAQVSALGTGLNAVKQINEAIQEKFPNRSFSYEPLTDSTVIGYAYLQKNLPFEHEFDSWDDRLKFEGEYKDFFGLWHSHSPKYNKLRRQFNLVYYKSDDDFIIELYPEDEEHIIVLSKTKQFD